jgi:hypothetical protein
MNDEKFKSFIDFVETKLNDEGLGEYIEFYKSMAKLEHKFGVIIRQTNGSGGDIYMVMYEVLQGAINGSISSENQILMILKSQWGEKKNEIDAVSRDNYINAINVINTHYANHANPEYKKYIDGMEKLYKATPRQFLVLPSNINIPDNNIYTSRMRRASFIQSSDTLYLPGILNLDLETKLEDILFHELGHGFESSNTIFRYHQYIDKMSFIKYFQVRVLL